MRAASTLAMPGPVAVALLGGGEARLPHPANETAASNKPSQDSAFPRNRRHNGPEFGVFTVGIIAERAKQ